MTVSLVFAIEKGTDDKYRIFYRPLGQPGIKPIHSVGEFDADYTFMTTTADLLVQNEQECTARQGRGDRHATPEPGALGRVIPRRPTRSSRSRRSPITFSPAT